MKLTCDFGAAYVLLNDKIDYHVSTKSDYEHSNDIECGTKGCIYALKVDFLSQMGCIIENLRYFEFLR